MAHDCSGIRSSKARSAISASRSMTRSAFPSRSSCELIKEVAAPAETGRDPSQRQASAHSPTAVTAAKTCHSASRPQTAGRVVLGHFDLPRL
jgi:hypothetical protein